VKNEVKRQKNSPASSPHPNCKEDNNGRGAPGAGRRDTQARMGMLATQKIQMSERHELWMEILKALKSIWCQPHPIYHFQVAFLPSLRNEDENITYFIMNILLSLQYLLYFYS